jgi:hypothetical protein
MNSVRFQVLTAASMKFRTVFWDVLPCKIIVDRRFRGTCCLHHQGVHSFLMLEAARTSVTSVYNYFTRKYILEDNSEKEFNMPITLLPSLILFSISKVVALGI